MSKLFNKLPPVSKWLPQSLTGGCIVGAACGFAHSAYHVEHNKCIYPVRNQVDSVATGMMIGLTWPVSVPCYLIHTIGKQVDQSLNKCDCLT